MTDDPYVRELALALRAQDVPGPRIGEVIAEVEAHVSESGEPPAEAFGPPEEYAAAIVAALPAAGAAGRRPQPKLLTWLCIYAVTLGAMLAGAGLVALAIGQPMVLSLNWALDAALIPVGTLAFVRVVRRRRSLAPVWLLGAAVAAALFIQLAFLDSVVLWRVPSVLAVPAGVVIFAVGAAGVRTDRVIDPRTGAGRFELSDVARRRLVIAVLACVLGPLLVIGVFALTAR